MPDLKEALTQMAGDLDLAPDVLIEYAQEDDETGWDWAKGDWGIGSLFKSEGQFLYALVRALRPKTVVEFGLREGCSSKHILQALVKNRKGKLISVDHQPQINPARFTEAQQKRWQVIVADVFEADLPQADIVLEDLEHEIEETRDAVLLGLSLDPQLLLSHDALHFVVGEKVCEAWNQTGLDYQTVDTFDEPEEPNCGFVYWVNGSGE